MSWLREFKTFALRGNVLDMAIGVIIGMVFSNVVNSLIKDILMPPIGLLLSGVDFSELSLKLHVPGTQSPPVEVRYGAFLNNLVNFIVSAGAIFLMIKSLSRLHLAETQKFFPKNCPHCQMPIPVLAKKCGHCCSIVENS